MAISLPDARQLSDEVLQALRLRALRGCELGYTEIEVAELLGLSRETVSRLVDRLRRSMAWKLSPATAPAARSAPVVPSTTGKRRGCGRSSTRKAPRRWGSPPRCGPAGPSRDLIRKEYGIDMPVRTVGEYLERWGYTAKVPRRHAKDQDPEEVRRWLEETYPAIEQRAAARGCGDPLVRRDRRGGRPATAAGLRPRGAAGEDRGARSRTSA